MASMSSLLGTYKSKIIFGFNFSSSNLFILLEAGFFTFSTFDFFFDLIGPHLMKVYNILDLLKKNLSMAPKHSMNL